jgi:Holliday junction resolvase RusA-like endonuclease
MKIELLGRIPSKKNSKVMVCRGRVPILLPSKNYQDWHKDASNQLLKHKRHKGQEYHNIHCVFYAPDKRPFDLSNKFESVADLLVDNGVIKDDNCYVLENVCLLFGGVDKQNPRVVINLS